MADYVGQTKWPGRVAAKAETTVIKTVEAVDSAVDLGRTVIGVEEKPKKKTAPKKKASKKG